MASQDQPFVIQPRTERVSDDDKQTESAERKSTTENETDFKTPAVDAAAPINAVGHFDCHDRWDNARRFTASTTTVSVNRSGASTYSQRSVGPAARKPVATVLCLLHTRYTSADRTRARRTAQHSHRHHTASKSAVDSPNLSVNTSIKHAIAKLSQHTTASDRHVTLYEFTGSSVIGIGHPKTNTVVVDKMDDSDVITAWSFLMRRSVQMKAERLQLEKSRDSSAATKLLQCDAHIRWLRDAANCLYFFHIHGPWINSS